MPRGTRTAASSTVAVGMTITDRPSHRSVRARTALTVNTGGHRVSASVVRPPTDTAQIMDAGAFRAASSPSAPPAVAATDRGRRWNGLPAFGLREARYGSPTPPTSGIRQLIARRTRATPRAGCAPASR